MAGTPSHSLAFPQLRADRSLGAAMHVESPSIPDTRLPPLAGRDWDELILSKC